MIQYSVRSNSNKELNPESNDRLFKRDRLSPILLYFFLMFTVSNMHTKLKEYFLSAQSPKKILALPFGQKIFIYINFNK